jgi:hypothetical protein
MMKFLFIVFNILIGAMFGNAMALFVIDCCHGTLIHRTNCIYYVCATIIFFCLQIINVINIALDE